MSGGEDSSSIPTPIPPLRPGRLMAGNARFVESSSSHPNQDAARRASLLSTQHPFAVIFGCSDSRLAAEIIFDLGLGDAFVVRTAGHVIDNTVLGSLEYSVEYLEVPLIVVLGHDSCGAVTATQDAVATGDMPAGFIRDLVERITPSVLTSLRKDKDSDVSAMIEEHVKPDGRPPGGELPHHCHRRCPPAHGRGGPDLPPRSTAAPTWSTATAPSAC